MIDKKKLTGSEGRKYMNSVVLTIRSLLEAFDIIRDAKLKKYYFLPGVLNMGLIYILYKLSKVLSGKLFENLEALFKLETYESLAFLAVKILVACVAFLLYFFVYKALLLILLSPFLSYISERVESHTRERKFDFTLKENLHFIWRGVVISVNSFAKESVATLIFLLLSLITPLNLLSPFMIFGVQCYFIGFSFMDYTLERHGYTPREGTQFLRRNALFAILNGGLFVGILIIPIVGIFLAPLISAVSITLGTLKRVEENPKPSQS